MQADYLSCKDVSKMTGVPIRAVWRWCQAGRLKYICPTGRDYLIAKKDLEAFLNSDIGILSVMRAKNKANV